MLEKVMTEFTRLISAHDLSEVSRTNLTPTVYDRMRESVVAVAGLGGLGSVVVACLARACVGKLIIADFDIVETGNLNRQQYFVDQLGKFKVDAAAENLARINPYMDIEKHCTKLDPDLIQSLFSDADVIVECFDKPDQKQMIAETVLSRMSPKVIISASGMAGYANSNTITTRRINQRWIMVGDEQTEIAPDRGLFAARVGIAACHQANAAIQILVDEIKK